MACKHPDRSLCSWRPDHLLIRQSSWHLWFPFCRPGPGHPCLVRLSCVAFMPMLTPRVRFLVATHIAAVLILYGDTTKVTLLEPFHRCHPYHRGIRLARRNYGTSIECPRSVFRTQRHTLHVSQLVCCSYSDCIIHNRMGGPASDPPIHPPACACFARMAASLCLRASISRASSSSESSPSASFFSWAMALAATCFGHHAADHALYQDVCLE